MGKLSGLPVDTTFGTSDYMVKVKAAAGGDVLVTLANFLKAVASANLSQWITPTIGTGWVAFDSGGAGNYGGPQYMKDSLGFVHLRGLAKNNSGSTNTSTVNPTIFTLPSGFRPYERDMVPTIANDNFMELIVYDTGLISLNALSVTNGGWISLNNITFLAEN